MFETLIESKRKTNKKRLLGVGFVSLTIHTVLIAAAIIATVQAGQSDDKVPADTTLVIVLPSQQNDGVFKGFRRVRPHTEIILPYLPQIDPPGGGFGCIHPPVFFDMVPTGEVYPESLVEEKPALLSAPPAPYPDLLKQAGIQSRVVIQGIIDTSGRAEPNSVRIIQSPNPAFAPGSLNWILHALFRPARVHGRPVRVRIQVPLRF